MSDHIHIQMQRIIQHVHLVWEGEKREPGTTLKKINLLK